MATNITKFNSLVEAIAEKKHNFASDQLKIALTNTAPLITNSVLADLTEIAYTNLSARLLTTVSSSQTSGVYKLIVSDLDLTVAGGSVATFRYIVVYNDTATNKELIGFYDYGVALALVDGNIFTLDFDNVNGLFQLT